jgi:glucose/arabinose dehydrogenase
MPAMQFNFLSKLPTLLTVSLIASLNLLGAPSDGEPEKQKEADWVDARWSQTDFGNFLGSILPLPNGKVAKGLSVRVGGHAEGAVVYDTGSGTLRGGWTDGFLKFSPARYGLIEAPQPGGPVMFVSPATPAWGGQVVKWHGLHVNGPRVVLDYKVGDTRVEESPWFESGEDVRAITRTLEIAPTSSPLTLALLESGGRKVEFTNLLGARLASFASTNGVIAIATSGDSGADLKLDGGVLHIQFAATKSVRRLKIFIASCVPEALPKFAALVKNSTPPEDLSIVGRPDAPRWQPITTRGQRGFDNAAYVIDTLTVPYDNPWKALFFTSGVDFLPNGDAAVCTIHGDVWLVSGIDDALQKLTWRRFATGLFQPLGLRVRNGKIHVLGRDQITVLHDENSDGEADFYESFWNQVQTSTGGHDYVTSLDMDANGNFYYVDPKGVHRVSSDGAKMETLAGGWRNPNGMGVSSDGRIITVAPQQGDWTPSSSICEAKPGGWYGYAGPRVTPDRPLGFDPPLCWIPHRVDNSGGSQLWVTSDRWGPLRDHFLHFSFGRCAQFLVLREVVDGVSQGAIVPLPGRFLSGAMRGAFNPRDGQLYVVGSRGWQTSAVRDGCLQRVRYTGGTVLVPTEFHVHTNGLRLHFVVPLDRATAEDAGSYALTHWNYRYAKQYGSKDYLPSDPAKEGRESLDVRSAKLLPNGCSVFLEIAGLRPVMQFEVRYNLQTADGKNLRNDLHGTINRLGPAWQP